MPKNATWVALQQCFSIFFSGMHSSKRILCTLAVNVYQHYCLTLHLHWRSTWSTACLHFKKLHDTPWFNSWLQWIWSKNSPSPHKWLMPHKIITMPLVEKRWSVSTRIKSLKTRLFLFNLHPFAVVRSAEWSITHSCVP